MNREERLPPPASRTAQTSPGTWNGLPDRFQIDTGYFRMSASTVLRYDGPRAPGRSTSRRTWVSTRPSTSSGWTGGGGSAAATSSSSGSRGRTGTPATTPSSASSCGGARRTAPGSKPRPPATPTSSAGATASRSSGTTASRSVPRIGVGYLWLEARVQASGTVSGPGGVAQTRTLDEGASTGSITGAIGGYAEVWPAKRLVLRGDFLYVKVTPENAEASVTDWRVAADWYFMRNVGVGRAVQVQQLLLRPRDPRQRAGRRARLRGPPGLRDVPVLSRDRVRAPFPLEIERPMKKTLAALAVLVVLPLVARGPEGRDPGRGGGGDLQHRSHRQDVPPRHPEGAGRVAGHGGGGARGQAFNELKVGDKVTFRYYDSLVYQIRKPGEATAAGESGPYRGA